MDDLHLEKTTSIANRDEPIPIIRIPSRDDETSPSSSEAEQGPSKKKKLKEQANKIREVYGGGDTRPSLQDRFFDGLLRHIIPSEHQDEDDEVESQKKKEKLDRRSKKYVERPNFSLMLMNTNFRRFNARIGIVFAMQSRLIQLFTWRHTTATLSFMAVYSLLCLEPHLLPLAPLVGLLIGIMIPSFIARHPLPATDPRIEPSFRGPAVAPASRVKPAPELSKDFMRNMRDLQNCMEDFSRLHDAANEFITPYTNFSDERLSSGLFAFFFVLSSAAFLGSQLVSWRFIALVAGWLAILSGHPEVQSILLSSRTLKQILARIDQAQAAIRTWIDSDIVLDEPPDRRQVEIFELQKYHIYSGTWEPWLFSPSPYHPLSPLRLAGARAKGTQFFEDVEAPAGWAWKDKKWTLDLESREWVEQRMVTGVEIETEGERWVYDLPQEKVEMLETPTKGKKRNPDKEVPKSGWDEGNGFGERGEWRRRRWVRLVERKVVGKATSKPD